MDACMHPCTCHICSIVSVDIETCTAVLHPHLGDVGLARVTVRFLDLGMVTTVLTVAV